jgi:hypothetical protein
MARSSASYMGNHSGSPVQVHLPPCACSATLVGSDKGSAPKETWAFVLRLGSPSHIPLKPSKAIQEERLGQGSGH